MSVPPYTVTVLQGSAGIAHKGMAAVLAMRQQVFVAEQGIPAAADADGLDSTCWHVLVAVQQQPAASGRLYPVGGKAGHGVLSRIAVLPPWRGQGLSAVVLHHLEQVALQQGLATLSLHAHDFLELFYRKRGFAPIPGHDTQVGQYRLVKMAKNLKPAP